MGRRRRRSRSTLKICESNSEKNPRQDHSGSAADPSHFQREPRTVAALETVVARAPLPRAASGRALSDSAGKLVQLPRTGVVGVRAVNHVSDNQPSSPRILTEMS